MFYVFGASLFRRARKTCPDIASLPHPLLQAPFDIPTTPLLASNSVWHLSNPQPIKRRLPSPSTPPPHPPHPLLALNTSGGALDTAKCACLGVFCCVQCPSPHGLCPTIDAKHENMPRWAGFRVGHLFHPTSPLNMFDLSSALLSRCTH